MKNVIALISTLALSTSAFAGGSLQKPQQGGPCANTAKYGAMRSYRSVNKATGGDLTIVAFLTETADKTYTYSVNIDEGINDGADDGWMSATYVVKVKAVDGGKCKVDAVTEIENP